jgi:hypothetical protein
MKVYMLLTLQWVLTRCDSTGMLMRVIEYMNQSRCEVSESCRITYCAKNRLASLDLPYAGHAE